MFRLPNKIIKQSEGYIEVFTTKEIQTLNKFLPSKTAIKRCENKNVDWKYLAEIWEKYKRS